MTMIKVFMFVLGAVMGAVMFAFAKSILLGLIIIIMWCALSVLTALVFWCLHSNAPDGGANKRDKSGK